MAGTTRSTIVLGKRTWRSSQLERRAALALRQAREEVAHEPAQHLAVAGQVVAGDHGQRPGLPARGPPRDPARELADRGPRRPAGEVGGDLEVVDRQPAGGAVARVARLGHGQRDHVDARVGERRGEPGGLLGREQHVAHRGEDGDVVLLRPALDQAEQALLQAERLDGRGPALGDAEDAPVAAVALDRLGGVDGLVRAMEGADAQVDDPDGGPRVEPRARGAAGVAAASPAAGAAACSASSGSSFPCRILSCVCESSPMVSASPAILRATRGCSSVG